METQYDIVVIGSGPAGLTAAHASTERGKKVLLLERQNRLSMKLLASGGGRCNLSNTLSDDDFMASFGRNGRFMAPALKTAPQKELFRFLEQHGVPVEASDGFHYFPVSGRASDIAGVFRDAFLDHGGAIISGKEAAELLAEEGRITGVRTIDETILCRSVILAGGGTAWRTLGGTRKGMDLAERIGHTIVPPRPAMAPLIVSDPWPGRLAGVSLPDARLTFRSGRQVFSRSGELLFTHSGFSGPCALDLAGDLAELTARKGTAELVFQPDASKDAAFWKRVLEEGRQRDGAKLVRTLLAGYFPKSLSDVFASLAECGKTILGQLTSQKRDSLAGMLGGIICHATGAGPMDCAMAMKGGIKLNEVDPDSLESRLVRGLFFAGEILDLTGPCGGYNIRWAMSSGRTAGLHADGENRLPETDIWQKS